MVRFVAVLAWTSAVGAPVLAQTDEWAERRAAMVRTIEEYAASLPKAVAPDGISAAILDVMGAVPRHRFVPSLIQFLAYRDGPLPIGHGQTISQPFIVALMTELARAESQSVVLEIGTGSGYQAAVLSPLVKAVCTIEIIPELGEAAAKRLKDLGYANVKTKIGDGYFGWPDCGPFDAVLVTAAAGHVPPPLVEQLKPGGRMVIPVGGVYGPQYLTLVEKAADGQVTTRQVLTVRFVPFTREPQ
jgi:protein-L-isoaspartate(D-aspartate) O-methyltransferase